jgi:hypothetical protein
VVCKPQASIRPVPLPAVGALGTFKYTVLGSYKLKLLCLRTMRRINCFGFRAKALRRALSQVTPDSRYKRPDAGLSLKTLNFSWLEFLRVAAVYCCDSTNWNRTSETIGKTLILTFRLLFISYFPETFVAMQIELDN